MPDKDMITMLNATMNKDVDNGIYGWSCKRCSKKKSRAEFERAVVGLQVRWFPLFMSSACAVLTMTNSCATATTTAPPNCEHERRDC